MCSGGVPPYRTRIRHVLEILLALTHAIAARPVSGCPPHGLHDSRRIPPPGRCPFDLDAERVGSLLGLEVLALPATAIIGVALASPVCDLPRPLANRCHCEAGECEVESAPTLPPFAIPRCSSLQIPKNAPCSLSRENRLQHLETITKFYRQRIRLSLQFLKISLQIAIAWRTDRETVSLLTASSARQSNVQAHSTRLGWVYWAQTDRLHRCPPDLPPTIGGRGVRDHLLARPAGRGLLSSAPFARSRDRRMPSSMSRSHPRTSDPEEC
jgi:hypothetical protein